MTVNARAGRGRRAARPHRSRPAAVRFELRDGVAWLTLDRPTTANHLDAELQGALVDACTAAEEARGARVVVLAARGSVFSAGLPRGCQRPEPAWPDGVRAVAALTKPVVAALHGDAIGYGMALALACDLRIAARSAVLALPEVPEGTLPGGGVMARLARIVGPARALEIVLLGARLTATRAAAWGLVSRVVAAAHLHATVVETARRLAARGPLALRLAKEAVTAALDLPLGEGIRLEEDLYVLLQTTADRREGIRAFLAGRTPRFGAR
ncbi:MAG TPA: enoyl-CoA hydratase-related protein [Candidatus Nitrosopolaris sp.]|nr:enoyl-CoA hydratase-related protein [Candidatus Nitrosopolaris sp.]